MLEARANGADAVLLIVAALSDAELRELHTKAKSYGLDVLCEVHDAQELKRAEDLGFEVIGVNNRNLRTFEVDLNTSLELSSKFPPNVTRVAESGIHTGMDLHILREAGYHAFLIGESLMKRDHPGEELARLSGGSAAGVGGARMTWVKICGTTSVEDALIAVEAGADALGFVFATSPRRVTAEQVRAIVAELPASVEKVGVFVNESAERIREIVKGTGLTAFNCMAKKAIGCWPK